MMPPHCSLPLFISVCVCIYRDLKRSYVKINKFQIYIWAGVGDSKRREIKKQKKNICLNTKTLELEKNTYNVI